MVIKYNNKIIGIPLGLQYKEMKKEYPDWNNDIKRNVLTCSGHLQPLEICNTYTIQIYYALDGRPKVRVIEPEIITQLDGIKLPHYYNEGFLCIYFPYDNEWTPRKFISKTIVPWTSSWLYFYEVWLATGEWDGGGIHIKKNIKSK